VDPHHSGTANPGAISACHAAHWLLSTFPEVRAIIIHHTVVIGTSSAVVRQV
jgi:hypothetical protein